MTTVDVPGVIIPSCHILHEQILRSATMAYNILGLCKCAIIAIYHIDVGYTVRSFSSIGHFLTASECGSDNGRFTLFC